MRSAALFSFTFIISFLGSSLQAQQTTHEYSAIEAAHILTGSEAAERLGSSVSGGGDINADGYADFIVGSPDYMSRGRVFVVSGKSGQVLFEIQSPNPGDQGRFGASVANAGDYDQDGYDDWLVGDPGDDLNGVNAGRVFVFSGYNASLLFSYECDRMAGEACGSVVAGNCDYSNGSKDVLITASGGGAGGKVYVYRGFSFEASRSFESVASEDQFGYSLSCAGDFDRDGSDDIGIGSPGYANNSGRVRIYSGYNGDLLLDEVGELDDRFGEAIDMIGDLDGDGGDEVLIGAPQLNFNGYASIISSQTGESYMRIEADAEAKSFGAALTRMGDVNQDGIPDFLVGDPKHSSGLGQASIYSGADAQLLYRFAGESFLDEDPDFGRALFAAGDANADGIPDIIVGAPHNSAASYRAGRAYLFYTRPKADRPAPPSTDEPNEEPPVEPEPIEDPAEDPVCQDPAQLETIEDFIRELGLREAQFSDQDLKKLDHYLMWLRVERLFKKTFYPFKSKSKHDHKHKNKKKRR